MPTENETLLDSALSEFALLQTVAESYLEKAETRKGPEVIKISEAV